ncbi:hypothetical protein AAVH_36474 [Aphelenchoides avenae]|nr:hypothetical protein AAVH_36474 [Aphelenchus avenae]
MLEPLLSSQLQQTLRLRPSMTPRTLPPQQPAPIASEDSPTAADVTVTKDQLHRLMASTPGPRTSSRSPNMDRERNQ